MKQILTLVIACVAIASLASCGSTWTISGNHMEIEVTKRDTVVPAGTVIMRSLVPLEQTQNR